MIISFLKNVFVAGNYVPAGYRESFFQCHSSSFVSVFVLKTYLAYSTSHKHQFLFQTGRSQIPRLAVDLLIFFFLCSLTVSMFRASLLFCSRKMLLVPVKLYFLQSQT